MHACENPHKEEGGYGLWSATAHRELVWTHHSSPGFWGSGTGAAMVLSSSSLSIWSRVSFFRSIIFWVKSTRNMASVSSSDVGQTRRHKPLYLVLSQHKQFEPLMKHY